MRLPRPIDAATQARVSTEGRRCLNPPSLQSPSVMSARLFVRGLRRYGFSNPTEAVTRLLDGRHHLERFAMEQFAMSGNRIRAGIAAVAGVTLAAAGAAPAQAATSWAVLAGGLVAHDLRIGAAWSGLVVRQIHHWSGAGPAGARPAVGGERPAAGRARWRHGSGKPRRVYPLALAASAEGRRAPPSDACRHRSRP
jgi:hypothetical protein